jgi:4-hydroxy-tetrahydrodipicolinate reductase
MSKALSDPIGIVVCGAAGRMGRLLLALGSQDPALRIAGAIEVPGHPSIGRDAGELAGVPALGVIVQGDLGPVCRPEHVVIDFTGAPAATVATAGHAADRGAGLVIGTTGLDPAQDAAMRAAAGRTRAVVAANFSIGITVLLELVARAAELLDPSFEPEIVELHHDKKKDAPSGTALALGRAITTARGLDFATTARLAREGQVGARTQNEIGIVALRAGDAIGDHTVLFGGLGERLELIHRAQSRDSLVRGALRAAAWVMSRPNGVYSMRDVLGLG